MPSERDLDGWDLLAAPSLAQPIPGDYQVIVVGDRQLAIPCDSIGEVTQSLSPAFVPGVDPAILGVLMWDGQVCVVVSTHLLLGIARPESSSCPLLVEVEVATETFFIEIDEMTDIMVSSVSNPNIEQTPLVSGYLETAGERLAVLDLDALIRFSG